MDLDASLEQHCLASGGGGGGGGGEPVCEAPSIEDLVEPSCDLICDVANAEQSCVFCIHVDS